VVKGKICRAHTQIITTSFVPCQLTETSTLETIVEFEAYFLEAFQERPIPNVLVRFAGRQSRIPTCLDQQ